MIAKILAKIFGTQNERELRRLRPLVEQINSYEPAIQQLTDEQIKEKTIEFRQRYAQGESLDDLLPEAFAVAREASVRVLKMRHFDVQLLGGIILHKGRIAEMKTGEGKTLTATLPLYLNAIAGKGAHLVTVNDYLARRDAEWMRPLYRALDMEVEVIQNHMGDDARKKAYRADITYGTNNEFGFDFLRDNMKFELDDYVQREPFYAIVDEVDSILIDEARTPLIISGASEKGSKLYQLADQAICRLKEGEDYEKDEKERSVNLTEVGTDKIESFLKVENLYAPENILILHHVTQALRAHSMFKRDVDYVVTEGEVLIVDEFTGRILPGRRYSDGLHQALEAKEGVRVERENQTLATITLQNYFRLYEKLSGMTGTAETEAGEFYKIYKLHVNVVPTNKPLIRDDQPDIVFLTKQDKYEAIAEDIKKCHERGQPVLVGTIAIETSEEISYILNQKGVKHEVLNAKQHEREAEIVENAGEKGHVTIATNMAGRGTDIKLGEGVREAGGLRIIGTERHESRRIDNQLRGRAGRQGDPGSSKFYLSLDDDLMRIFGGPRLKATMERIGMKKGESIEHRMVTRSIEKAQEKVETHNFDIRKHLLEYDDVLNQQRTVVYGYRREILEGADQTKELIREMVAEVMHSIFAAHCSGSTCLDEEVKEIIDAVVKLTGLPSELFEKQDFSQRHSGALEQAISEFLIYEYEQYRDTMPDDVIQEAEKWTLLETVDQAWKTHLLNIDEIKEGIGLRGYGQKNPLIEYKRESFATFEDMMGQIKWDIVHRIFRLRPEDFSASAIEHIQSAREKELDSMNVGGDGTGEADAKTVRRSTPKVGRNDPCSCGSGKKYKHCCGRV